MYGYSWSYYGYAFELVAKVFASNQKALEIPADPRTLLHGTNVDDCAEAYLGIAQADHETVKGQMYNISCFEYELLIKLEGPSQKKVT